MKSIVSLLLLLILFILAGQASASYWFQITDVSPIAIKPNSDANFTVDVKGLGSEGAYVQVIFRNISEGLSLKSSDKLRYVFPTGTTRFNFTLHAGDIAPGNYSFDAGIAAKSSPPAWRKAYANVVTDKAMNAEEVLLPERESAPQNASLANVSSPESSNASAAKPAPIQENKSPGLGAILAITALLLVAGRKMR